MTNEPTRPQARPLTGCCGFGYNIGSYLKRLPTVEYPETFFSPPKASALKRLRDPGEAEDVTQEVFVTVFRALHTYAGNSSLLVWIFGITRFGKQCVGFPVKLLY